MAHKKKTILSRTLDRLLIAPITRRLSSQIDRNIKRKLNKADLKTDDKSPVTWEVPLSFNMQPSRPSKYNEVNVPYSVLRNFSVFYPVARACINYRKTQVSQLEFDIVRTEGEVDKRVIKEILDFFKSPGGFNTNLRNFIEVIIEDLLVIDAVSLYKERTFSNKLLALVPIDPTTIKLRVDKNGRTPVPPEIAYKQIIRGSVIAEMTTDEMFYAFMNPRSNSPYGLSPIESLISTIATALKASTYDSDFLQKGNIPEGFVELSQSLAPTSDKIKEWQGYFDLLVNGQMQRSLLAIPEGANYTPIKKPEDMSFEKFKLWLLQLTCAVFAVPPEELGFTYQTNKSTAEVQKEASIDRGLKPLATFVEGLFNSIIHEEFGYSDYDFRFTNIDEADEDAEIRKLETEIKLGIRSVDEIRAERGLEPFGIGPYILGQPTILGATPTDDLAETEEEETDNIEEKRALDLKRWRKKCMNDIERGRNGFRPFLSEYIESWMTEEIEDYLALTDTKAGVHKVFAKYMTSEGELERQLQELNTKMLKRNGSIQ